MRKPVRNLPLPPEGLSLHTTQHKMSRNKLAWACSHVSSHSEVLQVQAGVASFKALSGFQALESGERPATNPSCEFGDAPHFQQAENKALHCLRSDDARSRPLCTLIQPSPGEPVTVIAEFERSRGRGAVRLRHWPAVADQETCTQERSMLQGCHKPMGRCSLQPGAGAPPVLFRPPRTTGRRQYAKQIGRARGLL